MRKILVFFGVFLLILLPFLNVYDSKNINIVGANLTIEDDLQTKTEENLKLFDFSKLDEELKKLETSGEFGASSFLEKVKQLINGEYSGDFGELVKSVFNIFVSDFKKLVPLLATILALAILSNLLGQFKGSNKNLEQIVHFVCYMAY